MQHVTDSKTLPVAARDACRKDKRIVKVVVYDAGFVPNSYRFPAPAFARQFSRNPFTGRMRFDLHVNYDRKRSSGSGPYWVAFSAKGGRLASG